MYLCKHCNYSTKYNSNYNKHLRTKRHLKKISTQKNSNDLLLSYVNLAPISKGVKGTISDTYDCLYCNAKYTTQRYLQFHYKKCELKRMENNKQKIKLNDKTVESLQKDIKRLEDMVYQYQSENMFYREILVETGHMLKSSVSSMNYLITNYKEPPALESFFLKFKGLLEDDNSKKNRDFLEQILYSYRHKLINKMIGDIIIEYYVKEDPKDQSMWVTDCSRYSFAIRELDKKYKKNRNNIKQQKNDQEEKNQDKKKNIILYNIDDKNYKCKNTQWVRDKKGNKVKKIKINQIFK